MNSPNFFIIGAPKCGTSALAHYLSLHPRVFITTPKEPGFFSKDINPQNKIGNFDDYMHLYSQARPEQLAKGEATTQYLRSKVAVSEILRHFEDARFIVSLRHPVDFLASWHSQLLLGFVEDQPDFAKAWELQTSRAMGEHIPATCLDRNWLDYRYAANFGDQVERLLGKVAREQVFFLTQDKLQADTAGEYARVLEFLKTPHDDRREFPRINVHSHIRSQLVYKIVRAAILIRRRIPLRGNSAVRRWIRGLAHGVSVWNRAPGNKKGIPKELEIELHSEFLPQIEKLEQLTQLDLSNWRNRSVSLLQCA